MAIFRRTFTALGGAPVLAGRQPLGQAQLPRIVPEQALVCQERDDMDDLLAQIDDAVNKSSADYEEREARLRRAIGVEAKTILLLHPRQRWWRLRGTIAIGSSLRRRRTSDRSRRRCICCQSLFLLT